jgi:hypothetical protein
MKMIFGVSVFLSFLAGDPHEAIPAAITPAPNS